MSSGLIEQVVSGEAPSLVPLTVEQFHRMLESGILRDGDPIELLDGLLVRRDRAAAGESEMTHGARHALAVKRLLKLERAVDAMGCHLLVQLPVTLSPLDEPEPDLAIIEGTIESFSDHHPGAEDVLAVIEVADSSLGYDRGTKLRVYASAGVPLYVIVNIPEQKLEVYERPVRSERRYGVRTDHVRGSTIDIPVSSGGSVPLAVDDVFVPPSR